QPSSMKSLTNGLKSYRHRHPALQPLSAVQHISTSSRAASRPPTSLSRRQSMSAVASFDYALLRVVPRVERQEFINAGVVVFCLEKRYLAARIRLDAARLHALWPDADAALAQKHLEAVERICAGDPAAGPIAALSQRER